MVRRRVVQVINAHPKKRVPRNHIEELAINVLRCEKKTARELSIVFVDDRTIKQLNSKFLLHNTLTDVISFPLNNGDELEGEVYVDLDQAARQAKEYGVAIIEEVRRLVIHGILHLAGYDDRTIEQKHTMHTLEDKYLEWKNR